MTGASDDRDVDVFRSNASLRQAIHDLRNRLQSAESGKLIAEMERDGVIDSCLLQVDNQAGPAWMIRAPFSGAFANRDDARAAILANGQASDRAMEGVAALPPPDRIDWRAIFGYPPGYCPSPTGLKITYRRLARQADPDAGGSDAEMIRLNQARDAALAEMEGR